MTADCGLFGVWDHSDAAEQTYLGLFALQHRGQEGAGIATTDGCRICEHRGHGLVAEVFPPGICRGLPGRCAVGHVRYSTTGSSSLVNTQPFVAVCSRGQVAIAHNGNLVNARALHRSLEASGSIFRAAMGTESIARERSAEEVGQLLGVGSLYYQSLEALLGSASQPPDHYCTACWTGRYPIAIEEPVRKFAFEPTSAVRSEQASTESP